MDGEKPLFDLKGGLQKIGGVGYRTQSLVTQGKEVRIETPLPITEDYARTQVTFPDSWDVNITWRYGTNQLAGTVWDPRFDKPRRMLVRWSEPGKPELAPDPRPGWSFHSVTFSPAGNVFGHLAPVYKEDLHPDNRDDIFTWQGKTLRLAKFPESQGEFIGATGEYALFWNKIHTRANTVMRMRDGKLIDCTRFARKGETFVTAFAFVGHHELVYMVNTKSRAIIRKSPLPR